MVSELATRAANSGYEVTVVTGYPNHPHGEVYPGYRLSFLPRLETGYNYALIRCYVYARKGRSLLSRAAGYLSFFASSTLYLLFQKKQNVHIFIMPPPTSGITAVLIRFIRRSSIILNVQDIYPDAAIINGLIKNSILIKFFHLLERIIYKSARAIIVISQGFKKNLAKKGVSNSKLTVIDNWIDSSELVECVKDNPFSREHGLQDKFVVLYAGTIGRISGAEVVIKTAQLLSDQSDIVFLFVGEGAVKNSLIAESEKYALANTLFLPFQPRSSLHNVFGASDITLVTLKQGAGQASVPSKVIAYMAAGKPVIASVDPQSDTAEMLRIAESGVVVSPGSADEIAQAILKLKGDQKARQYYEKCGRNFVINNLDKSVCLDKYMHLIKRIIGPK